MGYEVNHVRKHQKSNICRPKISKNKFKGMGVNTVNVNGVDSLVMNLMDVFVKNIHVKDSVTPVKEEVLQKYVTSVP